MASNESNTPSPDPAALAPDNVSLRIIILAQGSNREDDLHLVIPLDTTVANLKDRLTQLLAGNPSPQSQRLIYHGRPLLDGSATLRSVLRLQASQSTPIPSHVLHLVIRSDGNPPPTLTTATAPTLPQQQRPTAPNVQAVNAVPPRIPGRGFDQYSMTQALQHQAAHMAQHMALHNHAHAHAHANAHNNAHTQAHAHAQAQHGSNTPSGTSSPSVNLVSNAAQQAASLNRGTGNPLNQNTHHIGQTSMTVRVQETILPNGERIRTVTNTGGPAPANNLNPFTINPVERSASAPGTAERSGTPVPDVNRPQAHPTPYMHPHPPAMPAMPIQLPRTFPLPFGIPAMPQPQVANPTVWLLSSPTGPQALLFAPGHGFFSTNATPQPTATQGSSSSGPSSTTTTTAQSQPAQAAQAVQQPQAADAAAGDHGNGQLVARPQNGAQAQGQPAAPAPGQQNRQAEEMAGFIIQRGWLFLRLYMFIFFFSASGTWRRTILLGLAIVVCCLPRDNVIYDILSFVRQRLEALIGPPAPPERRVRQPLDIQQQRRGGTADGVAGPQANNDNQNADQANQRRVARLNAMPTPADHARRLLREHGDRNRGFIRSIYEPLEQALVLFLASLIPGVGERHVEAREAARRIIAEEAERDRQEAEEAQNSQQAGQEQQEAAPEASAQESTSDEKRNEPSGTEAHTGISTGVEASSSSVNALSASDSGLRQRNADSET